MNKILTTITFLLFACATCVGQSSYKGLTPGRSTRADAERVLGQPVKSLSKTLVQYESSEEVVKVFVQYRDESPAAVVERIELTCSEVGGGTRTTRVDPHSILGRYRECWRTRTYFPARDPLHTTALPGS